MFALYRNFGAYTDPGEYAALFEGLPESFPEICRLIKAQFIHPIADLPRYKALIPKERRNEDPLYPTVRALLGGLLEHDPRGLVPDRKPQHRLMVTCRYHAILFASILKSRGEAVRVRYGFAPYLRPGYHIYHVICEVWQDGEKRWLPVDPDREMVDFPEAQFEFAGDVWHRYRKGRLEPAVYGVGDWWGAHPVFVCLCHDLAAVLGTEHLYWNQPPVSRDNGVERLAGEQLTVLDRVAERLTGPETQAYDIRALRDSHDFLQCKGDL